MLSRVEAQSRQSPAPTGLADEYHFLQTDPVGYEDDLNLYQYVGNDPLNRSDPTGRQAAPWQQRLNEFANDMRDRFTVGGQAMADDAGATIGAAVGTVAQAIRDDPGIIIDAAAITVDVVTVPSGEGPAIVAARRGLTELGESSVRATARESVDHASGAGARTAGDSATVAGRRQPFYRCTDCGAPHGGSRGSRCPDCETKREGGPPVRPADAPPAGPRPRHPEDQ